MDLEYTFRWTQREHVRASQEISRHMTGRQWPAYIIWAAVGLVGGAVLFQPAARDSLVPVLVVLVIVGALSSSPLTAWLAARRMKRDDPCLDHDIRHIVSASGFKVRSNAIAVDVDWTHMVQAVETAEFFLFYINKRTAYFTPKRVIPSSDLAVLRTALRQSIGAKARLWTESVAAA